MARPLRPWPLSSYFHIILNAHNKEFLFRKYNIKKLFLDRLLHHINRINSLSDSEFKIYIIGYAIMDNHIHLLIHIPPHSRPDDYIGSTFLKNLNSDFAQKLNKFLGRLGRVFWDRAKVKPVENLSYLKNLIKYIVANPVLSGKFRNIKKLKIEDSSYLETIKRIRSDYSIIELPEDDMELLLQIIKQIDIELQRETVFSENVKSDIEYYLNLKFYGSESWQERAILLLKPKKRKKSTPTNDQGG